MSRSTLCRVPSTVAPVVVSRARLALCALVRTGTEHVAHEPRVDRDLEVRVVREHAKEQAVAGVQLALEDDEIEAHQGVVPHP